MLHVVAHGAILPVGDRIVVLGDQCMIDYKFFYVVHRDVKIFALLLTINIRVWNKIVLLVIQLRLFTLINGSWETVRVRVCIVVCIGFERDWRHIGTDPLLLVVEPVGEEPICLILYLFFLNLVCIELAAEHGLQGCPEADRVRFIFNIIVELYSEVFVYCVVIIF